MLLSSLDIIFFVLILLFFFSINEGKMSFFGIIVGFVCPRSEGCTLDITICLYLYVDSCLVLVQVAANNVVFVKGNIVNHSC